MGISEFVKYILKVFLWSVRVLPTLLCVVEEEEGSFLPDMQHYFSAKGIPQSHTASRDSPQWWQLGDPTHVCSCSLLMAEGDTQPCLLHPVVPAALLTFTAAALSGSRHEQEPKCATFALKAGKKDNPSLRRLWLGISLASRQQGDRDFETEVRGVIADTCTLSSIACFNTWAQSVYKAFRMPWVWSASDNLDLRMFGHALRRGWSGASSVQEMKKLVNEITENSWWRLQTQDWPRESGWGPTTPHVLTLSELVEKKPKNSKKILEILN